MKMDPLIEVINHLIDNHLSQAFLKYIHGALPKDSFARPANFSRSRSSSFSENDRSIADLVQTKIDYIQSSIPEMLSSVIGLVHSTCFSPVSLVSQRRWTTTGCFPQKFIIEFTIPVLIKEVHFGSIGARGLEIASRPLGEFPQVPSIHVKHFEEYSPEIKPVHISLSNVITSTLYLTINSAYIDFVSILDFSATGYRCSIMSN